MPSLKYVVHNATVSNQQRAIEHEGEVGILTVPRLLVDLVAVDHGSGTIALDLAPDTEGFEEGAEVTVSITPKQKGA